MNKTYLLGSLILFAWALIFFAAFFAGPDQWCSPAVEQSRVFKAFVFGGPFVGVGLKWLGKKS